MNTNTIECPKCKGRMEEGFLLDKTHGGTLAAHWVEGPPERSFWTGVKVRGKRIRPVQVFRCTSCGLLESYAS
jgi:hypothetical protein